MARELNSRALFFAAFPVLVSVQECAGEGVRARNFTSLLHGCGNSCPTNFVAASSVADKSVRPTSFSVLRGSLSQGTGRRNTGVRGGVGVPGSTIWAWGIRTGSAVSGRAAGSEVGRSGAAIPNRARGGAGCRYRGGADALSFPQISVGGEDRHRQAAGASGDSGGGGDANPGKECCGTAAAGNDAFEG